MFAPTPNTHTQTHRRAPLEMGYMCIDIGLRRHSRISRIHSDTRRLKCVFTPALAHTDSRTDRWTDTCFYIRRNPLGSPGCARTRAQRRHFGPHSHVSSRMFTHPCFCEAAHTILPGQGLWAGASPMPPTQLSPWGTVATFLSPQCYCSLSWHSVAPPFNGAFSPWLWPYLLHARFWDRRCV